MKNERVKIFSLGESALTISFGNEISAELNKKVFNLDFYFKEKTFPGFIETVPAYCSLSIFFDVSLVRKHFPFSATAFEAVKGLVEKALVNLADAPDAKSRLIKIPVSFAEEHAPDLKFVASRHKISTAEAVEIFTDRTYRVYMLGFLPGFAYMGEVDERIAAPRKISPRPKVPKGSVGIAGRQTGIYSLNSPGGWQIIGKTNTELFTPAGESPTFLQPGDSVRFFAADL